MKSPWPLIFLPIEYSLFSLCFKIKTNARSCTKHLDKDTTRARNTAPFVCGKAWLYFRRQSGESCSKHSLRVENRLSIADYFCVYIMQYVSGMPCNCSPLPSQAYSFSEPMTTRARLRHNRFVQFLAIKLTLWVPFLSINRSSCRKKSILAKVCFGAERGYLANATKWIFI